MSTTTAVPTQCAQCKAFIEGNRVRWVWVNGVGPFCHDCDAKGIYLEKVSDGEWRVDWPRTVVGV